MPKRRLKKELYIEYLINSMFAIEHGRTFANINCVQCATPMECVYTPSATILGNITVQAVFVNCPVI